MVGKSPSVGRALTLKNTTLIWVMSLLGMVRPLSAVAVRLPRIAVDSRLLVGDEARPEVIDAVPLGATAGRLDLQHRDPDEARCRVDVHVEDRRTRVGGAGDVRERGRAVGQVAGEHVVVEAVVATADALGAVARAAGRVAPGLGRPGGQHAGMPARAGDHALGRHVGGEAGVGVHAVRRGPQVRPGGLDGAVHPVGTGAGQGGVVHGPLVDGRGQRLLEPDRDVHRQLRAGGYVGAGKPQRPEVSVGGTGGALEHRAADADRKRLGGGRPRAGGGDR